MASTNIWVSWVGQAECTFRCRHVKRGGDTSAPPSAPPVLLTSPLWYPLFSSSDLLGTPSAPPCHPLFSSPRLLGVPRLAAPRLLAAPRVRLALALPLRLALRLRLTLRLRLALGLTLRLRLYALLALRLRRLNPATRVVTGAHIRSFHWAG
eukprot:122893-Prorocentrum_minimum.AAC.2